MRRFSQAQLLWPLSTCLVRLGSARDDDRVEAVEGLIDLYPLHVASRARWAPEVYAFDLLSDRAALADIPKRRVAGCRLATVFNSVGQVSAFVGYDMN